MAEKIIFTCGVFAILGMTLLEVETYHYNKLPWLSGLVMVAWGLAWVVFLRHRPPAPTPVVRSSANVPVRRIEAQPPAPDPLPVAQSRQLSPRQQFEAEAMRIIAETWREVVSKAYRITDGRFDLKPGKPVWYSSTLKIPLYLTGGLCLPVHEKIAAELFKPALSDHLVGMAPNEAMKAKARQTAVTVDDGIINVRVRLPVEPPSTNILRPHVQRLFKPGVPLTHHDREDADIYALAGIDIEDNPIYIDFAHTGVVTIIGGQRSGKTGLGLGVGASIMGANPPDRVEFYVAAARPKHWGAFVRAPQCREHVFNDANGIADMLERVWADTVDGTAEDAPGTHASRIVYVDDLSRLTNQDGWKRAAKLVADLAVAGAGGQTYLIIITHRPTMDGGMGPLGTTIMASANCRIVTNTGGGLGEYARSLGLDTHEAKALAIPRERKESIITTFGTNPKLLTNVWAKPEHVTEIAGTKTTNQPTGVNRHEHNSRGGPTPAAQTTPQERNDYTAAYTNGNGYTESVDASTRHIPDDLRRQVIARDKNICAYCNGEGNGTDPTGQAWHIDHVQPWSKGGATALDNLVQACARCNQRKGAMGDVAFLVSQLMELDGRVPIIPKVGGQYAPDAWAKMRIYAAHRFFRMAPTTIAEIALGNKGSHQKKTIERYIDEGGALYNHVLGKINQTEGGD